MTAFVIIRNILICIFGVWFFEFHLDYKLPEQDNLLLFFVAIPIIWATLTQLWTSFSYKESGNPIIYGASHLLSMLMLFSTVFLVSAVLNTVSDRLDLTGVVMFHGVGWTVIFGMVIYDIIDINR